MGAAAQQAVEGLHARQAALGRLQSFEGRLADAIVSVEYYMETLQAGRSDPWYMLDNAEIALRAVDAQPAPAGTVSLLVRRIGYAPKTVTGIVLAMHYVPHVDHAFASVERIMRDVNYGWLIRYMHANGASMFFIAVYIHMFRGLYYGSYKAPRELLWMLGVVIFLLMMATAFMGYVLPWGQMSYWAAQVITGLFSSIPLIGDPLREWLLGGFAPGNATLNRFFSLHFLLPFVILGVVILHVWALHINGSSNPTGVEVKSESDTVPFYPYYVGKDGWTIGLFMIIYSLANWLHRRQGMFLAYAMSLLASWGFTLPFVHTSSASLS